MRRALESIAAAGCGLAGAVLLGFVFAGFHNPVALGLVATVAGVGWWYRDRLRPPSSWSRGTWALVAAIAILATLFLISPSYVRSIAHDIECPESWSSVLGHQHESAVRCIGPKVWGVGA